MLAPFALLVSPVASFIPFLAAFLFLPGRGQRWVPIVWLPVTLWNLLGTLTFLSATGLLIKEAASGGEFVGFAVMGAAVLMGARVLFVGGLILCAVGFPLKKTRRRGFIFSSAILSLVLLAGAAWATRCGQTVRVVDSTGNPISGTKVYFKSNEELAGFNTRGWPVTDSNGETVIHGYTHQRLTINPDPFQLYHVLAHERTVAVTLEKGHEKSSPIVFHLRKKGEGETLMHFHKSFHVSTDGTPIQIDLTTGDRVSSGENTLKVAFWTQDAGNIHGKKLDWKCQNSVSGGGLQIYDEEFPFLAPEKNYVSTDEIDMTSKPETLWSQDVKRSYFIRTADNKYARMDFRIIAHGDHFCTIDCYFNPSGSRNLEPK